MEDRGGCLVRTYLPNLELGRGLAQRPPADSHRLQDLVEEEGSSRSTYVRTLSVGGNGNTQLSCISS